MQGVPIVSGQLRMASGGLEKVLEAMRASDDEEIQSFLEKYDQIPTGDRERLTWEEIATAAGVLTRDLLGGAMIALQAQQANIASIMAMTSHPEVMKTRIRMAKRNEGIKDRDALDTALGFLPSSKGGITINNRVQTASMSMGPGSQPEDRDIAVPAELKMMDEQLPEWNEIRQNLLNRGA
jgi:hypothetical protein